jgi:hypothetical protein
MTSTLETIRDIEVREVTLHAIVEGDWLIPIDQSGNRIGKKVRASKVGGRLESHVLSEWCWTRAIQRMLYRALSNSYPEHHDPWTVRINSLASSLRVRRRLPQRMPHSRQRFERYSTSTWEESVHRLWEQANSRKRKALLTGWDRWAATVSRNHNRKGN